MEPFMLAWHSVSKEKLGYRVEISNQTYIDSNMLHPLSLADYQENTVPTERGQRMMGSTS